MIEKKFPEFTKRLREQFGESVSFGLCESRSKTLVTKQSYDIIFNGRVAGSTEETYRRISKVLVTKGATIDSNILPIVEPAVGIINLIYNVELEKTVLGNDNIPFP